MAIELLGSQAIAGAGQDAVPVGKAQTGLAAGGAVPEDTTTISAGAAAVPSLVSQALSAAEARQAKVDALSRSIANATYSVDPSLIADALIKAGL